MRNDANYALTVANGYLQKFSDDFTFFQAKTILGQAGARNQPGTALILQAWGAKSVIVVIATSPSLLATMTLSIKSYFELLGRRERTNPRSDLNLSQHSKP